MDPTAAVGCRTAKKLTYFSMTADQDISRSRMFWLIHAKLAAAG